MYANRAGMHPNDFLEKLQIDLKSLNEAEATYLLTRKQHAAMLYKAGVSKTDEVLTESEEAILQKINTSTLIQELERRTRS